MAELTLKPYMQNIASNCGAVGSGPPFIHELSFY